MFYPEKAGVSDAAAGIQEITVDKIAVLIPCYNEEKTIGKVVSDWRKSLPEAMVYVYDNNSTDRTAEIALEAGAVVMHTLPNTAGRWRSWSLRRMRIWWSATGFLPHILKKIRDLFTIWGTVW